MRYFCVICGKELFVEYVEEGPHYKLIGGKNGILGDVVCEEHWTEYEMLQEGRKE